jgi:glutathione synthase/RimK-type ligase-like ATP-grasp enzyme
MPRVDFITYSGEPDISADDLPLARALEERGFAVRACPWDDAEQHCSDPATVVIRSPWNYDSAPGDFLLWLERLEQSGHRVINPCSLVRWNIHKGYLMEAAARGLAIPQTALLPRSDAELDTLMSTFAKHEYVVLKPTISLSAHHTSRIRSTEIVEHAHRLALTEREYLIQEFVPEITSGELSFVFFGGQFSHCIRKTPKTGDFRTQGELGATQARYEPTYDEIDGASQVLALAPEQPLFARVDLVRRGSTLLLMELELIDPTLFLGWAPESVSRLANLIADETEVRA